MNYDHGFSTGDIVAYLKDGKRIIARIAWVLPPRHVMICPLGTTTGPVLHASDVLPLTNKEVLYEL